MSTPLAPIKTPLGQDELRHRTRGLGQRYRTILLLVDGRRPVSEVLSLALQAGADTSQFEELVRLGLVELPAEAMAPDPRETAAGGLDLLRVTSVEMEVQETSDEPEPEAAPPDEAPPAPVDDEFADTVPPPLPEPQVMPAPVAATPVVPPPPPPPPPPKPVVRAAPAPQPRPVPRPAPAPAPRTSVKPIASSPPVAMQYGDEAWLRRVRELLIDTLRLDAPLFSARTFVRVRSAQTASELTDLVWEIERHLSHARHTRAELISLQRARELLGLGNTLVAYDTEPGPDDW